MTTLVTGAGGFIGGHIVARLMEEGEKVVCADWKATDQWWQLFPDNANYRADLNLKSMCKTVVGGCDSVIHLAADMGGMGFIANNKARCMLSVLSSTHMLSESRMADVGSYFYASSACIYPAYAQESPMNRGLAENMAFPADPEDGGYGWEKLFSEILVMRFHEDFGMNTHSGRYHNVYGPHGTWTGGREKAPSAICRKVAEAVLRGSREIEIWGDGKATRSFTYIDDCVEGTLRLLRSDVHEPLNIGSDEMVSINQLVTIVEEIAGVKLKRKYVDGPQGVRGRNSENTLIKERLGWAPSISLTDGLTETYKWIYDQLALEH